MLDTDMLRTTRDALDDVIDDGSETLSRAERSSAPENDRVASPGRGGRRRQRGVTSAMATADDVETYRRHSAELDPVRHGARRPGRRRRRRHRRRAGRVRQPAWHDVANRRAYLYRAVLHHSSSHHRSTTRRRRREDRALALAPAPGDPPEPSPSTPTAPSPRSASSSAPSMFLTYWEDLAPGRRSPSCSTSPRAPCASSSPGPATTSGGSSMPDLPDLDTRIRELVARAVADAPAAARARRGHAPRTAPTRHDRPPRAGGSAAAPRCSRRPPRSSRSCSSPTPTTASARRHVPTTVAARRRRPRRRPRRRHRRRRRSAADDGAGAAAGAAVRGRPSPGYVATAGPRRSSTVRTLRRHRARRAASTGPAAIARCRSATGGPSCRPTRTPRRRSWSADGDDRLTPLLLGRLPAAPIALHDVAVVDGRPLLLFAIGRARHARTQPDGPRASSTWRRRRRASPLGEHGGCRSGAARRGCTWRPTGSSSASAAERPAARCHRRARIARRRPARRRSTRRRSARGRRRLRGLPRGCTRWRPTARRSAWIDGDVLVTRAVDDAGLRADGAAHARPSTGVRQHRPRRVRRRASCSYRLQPDGRPATARCVLWADRPTASSRARPRRRARGRRPARRPRADASDPAAVHRPSRRHDDHDAPRRRPADPAGDARHRRTGRRRPWSRAASRCAGSTSRPRSPLLTPGGAVIFQPARPSAGRHEPGDPLIWRPDGTVERVPRRAAGRPVVPPPRRGRRRRRADGAVRRAHHGPPTVDPTELRARCCRPAMDPAGWRTDEHRRVNDVGGRLSAGCRSASGGLVVGERSELVSHALLLRPSCPARRPPARASDRRRSLGLEPSYGDCRLPRDFTISGRRHVDRVDRGRRARRPRHGDGDAAVVDRAGAGRRRSSARSTCARRPTAASRSAISFGWLDDDRRPSAGRRRHVAPRRASSRRAAGRRVATFGP